MYQDNNVGEFQYYVFITLLESILQVTELKKKSR